MPSQRSGIESRCLKRQGASASSSSFLRPDISVEQGDKLSQSGSTEFLTGHKSAGVVPSSNGFLVTVKKPGDESVVIGFHDFEVSCPFGGLLQSDLFFTLPTDGVKQ